MKISVIARNVLSRPTIRNRATVAVNGADFENVTTHDRDWARAIPYGDMPGPRPMPLLGNSWRFLPYVGDFEIEHIDKVTRRLHAQYGNVVKMSGLLGRPDMVFVFNADDIEKVFRQEDMMPLRPSMPSLNYYKHTYRRDFFGDVGGVIAVHGEKWQSFRSKVNQIMMQPRIAKLYVKPIEETAGELVKRISEIRDDNGEVPGNFLNELHKWSLESIANIALDVRLNCFNAHASSETQQLIDAVNTFFINVPVLELKIPFWRLWNTPTFQKYIAALETIRCISMKHVNVAMDNMRSVEKNHHDMSVLQRVLMLDNDPKVAAILALDLFLVGIDTTSNAVASILYQLATHAEKQELLYREIAHFLPDDGNEASQLDSAKLEQMVYLKACIRETMRMYPVVIGNGRCTSKDSVIGGYQIPKGVQIIFQHYVISNLDKYFERSGEFIPERWLKPGQCPYPGATDAKINRNHHAFASLPFGFGRRMCLGRRFADIEIQSVIAKVLQRFRVSYDHEPLDYHVHPMYTPDGPLRLTFSNRHATL